MTSTGMIAEGRTTSIVPVASSISVASVASGGAVQESALVTQATAATAEGGTVTPTYAVAGDLSMKSVLISVSEPVPPVICLGHCWGSGDLCQLLHLLLCKCSCISDFSAIKPEQNH